jgi:hypothetical protein
MLNRQPSWVKCIKEKPLRHFFDKKMCEVGWFSIDTWLLVGNGTKNI